MSNLREYTCGVAQVSRGRRLLAVSVLFILAPKVQIFTGVRIEDLVYLVMLPLLLSGYHARSFYVPVYIRFYIAYLVSLAFSTLINYSEVGAVGILHVLRQLQYLVWFLVGVQVALSVGERGFKKAMGVVAAVLIIWWVLEIFGLIPKVGLFSNVADQEPSEILRGSYLYSTVLQLQI